VLKDYLARHFRPTPRFPLATCPQATNAIDVDLIVGVIRYTCDVFTRACQRMPYWWIFAQRRDDDSAFRALYAPGIDISTVPCYPRCRLLPDNAATLPRRCYARLHYTVGRISAISHAPPSHHIYLPRGLVHPAHPPLAGDNSATLHTASAHSHPHHVATTPHSFMAGAEEGESERGKVASRKIKSRLVTPGWSHAAHTTRRH